MPLKTWLRIAKVLVHGVGNRVAARVAPVMPALGGQQHQLFGMLHRQQFQNELMNQREDGRVGADPQRQRKHGHRGEQGRFSQSPQRIAQVL